MGVFWFYSILNFSLLSFTCSLVLWCIHVC